MPSRFELWGQIQRRRPLHISLDGRHFLEKRLAFGSKVSVCVCMPERPESAAGGPAPEILPIRGLRQ